MTTKQQILDDFTQAFKQKDEVKKRTLASVKAEILVFEKQPAFAKASAGKQDITSEQLIDILKSMAKKRRESIEAYTQAGRDALALAEQEELAVIESYLPEQMSEEHVREAVQALIEAQGLTKADFGKAMGMAMAQLKGKADGNIVSKVLKELLS